MAVIADRCPQIQVTVVDLNADRIAAWNSSDLSRSAFGKQFKRADRTGARWAVVIGDSEADAGVALLKDLRPAGGAPTDQEERLSLEELRRRFA